MPFKDGSAHMFRDWKPDSNFDPASDRLLVTTNFGDSFVVCGGPEEDDNTTLIVDIEFMPENLANIPTRLKQKRRFPFEWNPSVYPWRIKVFDGYGPHPDLFAAGVGWTLSVKSGFTIKLIESVRLADINPEHVTRELGGLYFDKYTLNEVALYEEAFRQLQQTLEST